MEKLAKEDNINKVTATSEDPYFRKNFPDGSFIESEIEDVTEELAGGIDQVGGTHEYRTLKVWYNAIWGSESFHVKIEFPLIGYAKIVQAYNWYYIGAINSVDYRGIYRASETASQDAVAIQRLQVGHSGIYYIAKLDFRIRNGRYWLEYSQ